MRIRLRHLQCFVAVAQAGNLRRAALALSVTQPAVTKTLNELEALLAKPLFLRGRHGATLTAEGEAFMRHAHDSLASLGHAVDAVLCETDAAPLRIGVLPTVAPSFLPPVLQAFALRCPRVGVQVRTGRNAELIEQLRARELDAVIGRLSDPALMAGLSFEPLYAEPMVIVMRPGHALAPSRSTTRTAKTKSISPRDALAACPLVLPPGGTLIRQVADGFLGRHGVRAPAGSVETLDTSLARALVLSGDNLWFTPAGTVQADIAAGTLRQWGAALTPEEAVGLMLRTEPHAESRTETRMSAPVQAFVAAVRAHAAARRTPRKRRAPR